MGNENSDHQNHTLTTWTRTPRLDLDLWVVLDLRGPLAGPKTCDEPWRRRQGPAQALVAWERDFGDTGFRNMIYFSPQLDGDRDSGSG